MATEPRRCRARQLRQLGALWLLPAMLACNADRTPDSASTQAPTGPIAAQTGLHRLNTLEYNATVEDVLGTKLQPASASWRGGEIAGFDNIASQLGVDEAQYDRYFRASQALATNVMASAELRARVVGCDLSDAACVDQSIQDAGLRLFRRPLESEELTSYGQVYADALALDDDPNSAFELVLEALLASAQFLYRIELDADPASAEPHPLDGYALASRLSYLLWSSAPDAELLHAAGDGSLLDAPGLSASVDRLLDEGDTQQGDGAKSWRFVASFAGQWLGERQVPSHAAPAWSAREAAAAAQEMLFYFNDFLRSERSWSEFPTADFNYVNGELPFLYGMPVPDIFGDPPPDDWTSLERFWRVEYAADQRAGFFGLAGFLALTSFDRRTSPSKRGKWIAGNLLCAEPPPPPQVLPTLDSGDPEASLDVRARLEEHRKNPACAACHALFDPYGLALEHFDPVGRYRETYDDGTAIDSAVQLPDGARVSDALALSQQVATDPRLNRCLATKLFTYGMGRVVTDADQPELERISEEWLAAGKTPSMRRLLHTLVASDAFRFRRGGG